MAALLDRLAYRLEKEELAIEDIINLPEDEFHKPLGKLGFSDLQRMKLRKMIVVKEVIVEKAMDTVIEEDTGRGKGKGKQHGGSGGAGHGRRGKGRSKGGPVPTSRRRAVCVHWARGQCWRGAACSNLHGFPELPTPRPAARDRHGYLQGN